MYGVELSVTFCLPPSIIIDKVPKNIHQLNKDAYTPQVVSIGPLHYARLHSNKLNVYKNKCMVRYTQESKVTANYIARLAVQINNYY